MVVPRSSRPGSPTADLGRIAFSTSAGVHAEPLAEYAVFGLMAGAKTLPRLLQQQQDTQWTGRWEMGLISQQRILLVGLGSIGRATASKLNALGATVIGTSRSDEPVDGVDEIVHPDALVDAVSDVDGIVVSLPGTAATEGLVSADVFAKVKPGVTVVSVGRGTVIDEAAMIDALADGRVGFAALDVFAVRAAEPAEPALARSERVDQPAHRRSQLRRGPAHRPALRPQRDPIPGRSGTHQPGQYRRVLLSLTIQPPGETDHR